MQKELTRLKKGDFIHYRAEDGLVEAAQIISTTQEAVLIQSNLAHGLTVAIKPAQIIGATRVVNGDVVVLYRSLERKQELDRQAHEELHRLMGENFPCKCGL